MSKYDILFERIVQNEEFSSMVGNEAHRYRTVMEGKKSLNKHIRSIAEIVDDLGKKIEQKRHDGKQSGNAVVLDNSDMQSLYRKVVSLLTK